MYLHIFGLTTAVLNLCPFPLVTLLEFFLIHFFETSF